MGKTAAVAMVCAAALVSLGGCYESPDVTVYQPGVYKGSRDPLLALERTDKQQQRLQERFKMVQTDR